MDNQETQDVSVEHLEQELSNIQKKSRDEKDL
jgi:hypothetical protein